MARRAALAVLYGTSSNVADTEFIDGAVHVGSGAYRDLHLAIPVSCPSALCCYSCTDCFVLHCRLGWACPWS